jgi:hypothetical protein
VLQLQARGPTLRRMSDIDVTWDRLPPEVAAGGNGSAPPPFGVLAVFVAVIAFAVGFAAAFRAW